MRIDFVSNFAKMHFAGEKTRRFQAPGNCPVLITTYFLSKLRFILIQTNMPGGGSVGTVIDVHKGRFWTIKYDALHLYFMINNS